MSKLPEKKEQPNLKKDNFDKNGIKRWFSFNKPKEGQDGKTVISQIHLDEDKKKEETKKTLKSSFAVLLSKIAVNPNLPKSDSPTNNKSQSAREKSFSKESVTSRKSGDSNVSSESSILKDIFHTESDEEDDFTLDEKLQSGSEKPVKQLSPRIFEGRRGSYEPQPRSFSTIIKNFKAPKTPTTPVGRGDKVLNSPRTSDGNLPSERPRTPILPSGKPSIFTPEILNELEKKDSTTEKKDVEKTPSKKLPLVKRRSKSVGPEQNQSRSPVEKSNDIFVETDAKEIRDLKKEKTRNRSPTLPKMSVFTDIVEIIKKDVVQSPRRNRSPTMKGQSIFSDVIEIKEESKKDLKKDSPTILDKKRDSPVIIEKKRDVDSPIMEKKEDKKKEEPKKESLKKEEPKKETKKEESKKDLKKDPPKPKEESKKDLKKEDVKKEEPKKELKKEELKKKEESKKELKKEEVKKEESKNEFKRVSKKDEFRKDLVKRESKIEEEEEEKVEGELFSLFDFLKKENEVVIEKKKENETLKRDDNEGGDLISFFDFLKQDREIAKAAIKPEYQEKLKKGATSLSLFEFLKEDNEYVNNAVTEAVKVVGAIPYREGTSRERLNITIQNIESEGSDESLWKSSPKFNHIKNRKKSSLNTTSSSDKELQKKESFGFDLELTDIHNTVTEDCTRKESYNDDQDTDKAFSDEDEDEEKDHPGLMSMMKKREEVVPKRNDIIL